ncbi:MAG: amidohydrolase [Chloroflexi bacterium]|nr:amidohydrolase [Chloroflexota bacterium]
MATQGIIEVHTHTFRTADMGLRWQRALGNASPPRAGTVEELLKIMGQANIVQAVMLMYTPTQFMYEARVKDIPAKEPERSKADAALKAQVIARMVENNEWACQVTRQHPNLVSFLGVDPVFMTREEMAKEIDDKVKKGAKGVKIVPINLRMYGSDPRLWPVYEECHRRRLPLLSQAGGSPEGGHDPWGRPKYFEEAARAFPNMRIILAHLGAGYEAEVAALTSKYPNVFADLSGRLHLIGSPGEWTREEAAQWIRRIGADRVMFGTNFPMNDPAQYARVLDALPLTEEEKARIGAGNARRVIGL